MRPEWNSAGCASKESRLPSSQRRRMGAGQRPNSSSTLCGNLKRGPGGLRNALLIGTGLELRITSEFDLNRRPFPVHHPAFVGEYARFDDQSLHGICPTVFAR